jgi:hypothetical protein
MTPTDYINQQADASYVRKTIWPGNTRCFQRVEVSGGMKKKTLSDDTKKGCITSGCGWKVIQRGNDTRNHKQQVLLTEGNFMQELFE